MRWTPERTGTPAWAVWAWSWWTRTTALSMRAEITAGSTSHWPIEKASASDCFTNQGSIVEYKGEWFAFYHTISLSNNPALRSICADKLYHNEDGTIRMVKQHK